VTERLEAGDYAVDLVCPRCGAIAETVAQVGAKLTVPSDGAGTLAVTVKALKVPHVCGREQLALTFDLEHGANGER
jgi:hypothetical protein